MQLWRNLCSLGSKSYTILVWEGNDQLQQALRTFGYEPNVDESSAFLRIPPKLQHKLAVCFWQSSEHKKYFKKTVIFIGVKMSVIY